MKNACEQLSRFFSTGPGAKKRKEISKRGEIPIIREDEHGSRRQTL